MMESLREELPKNIARRKKEAQRIFVIFLPITELLYKPMNCIHILQSIKNNRRVLLKSI